MVARLQHHPASSRATATAVMVDRLPRWAKHTNVVRDPRVTLGLIEPNNAYERVEIRGEVVEIIEGVVAEEHLDDLAERYLGIRPYPWRRFGERRVVLVIEPRKIIHHLDDDDPSTLPVA